MKVGIIGTGHIGGTLARLLVSAGHDIMLANSRGPESLQGFAQELGPRAHAGTVEDAARFGKVDIVSVPLKAYLQMPPDAFAGKIVVDTMNYYPQRDGHFSALDEGRTTSSELFQRHLPGARMVKAFNAIRWNLLAEAPRPHGDPSRLAIPISGDDPEAKRIVQQLIDDIGFDSVDAGPLGEGGRRHQVGSAVYTVPLSRRELASRLSMGA